MGLIGETQTDLSAAFDDDLADIVKEFTMIKEFKGNYNASTGKHSSAKERYESRGIFEHYETKELNNEIKIGDVKLTCLVSELEEEPKIDDVILRHEDDLEFDVKNVKPVFGISYEVQLRGT